MNDLPAVYTHWAADPAPNFPDQNGLPPHPYLWKGLPPMNEPASNKTVADRILRDLDSNPAEDRAYLVQHYAEAALHLAQAADLLTKSGYARMADECAMAATQMAFEIKALATPGSPSP